MITLPDLYPFQETLRDDLRKSFKTHRELIACMPPGSGKTRCAKWMLGSFANRGKQDGESGFSVFAVHRRGLVDNASDSFNESPALEHGVIMSGVECNGGHPVQVASIDTLISWFCEAGHYESEQTYDLVVFDECHSHHSKLMTFLKAHAVKRESLGLKPAFVLGLTATPQAKGLSDLYKEIVLGPTTEWLIENEYLCPFRYFRSTQGHLDLLVRRGDEFTEDSVAAAMDNMAGELVRDWKEYAQGRATVGFFPRLKHAKEAQAQLIEAGVKCEYVDGSTSDDKRHKIFAALNEGSIDYVCNVGVVERGTDIPRISCIQLCTAVGSVVRYRQMVGRGSRMHHAKTDCIVLDHGQNVMRHGFFEDPIEWTLDWTERAAKMHEARITIECPKCSAIYRGGKCAACGYEPSKPERKAQGLDFDGSELKEIKQHAKPKKKMSNEQIYISSLFMAGKSGKTFKQALGISYRQAKDQGTTFRVPKKFSVAGVTYQTVAYGHTDSNRNVSVVYPFTIGDYNAPCKWSNQGVMS